MRLILLGAAAVGLLAATTPASAQQWPWCAILVDRDGSATNCGFATLQQCQATISGIGGYCQPNPRFRAEQPRRRRPDR